MLRTIAVDAFFSRFYSLLGGCVVMSMKVEQDSAPRDSFADVDILLSTPPSVYKQPTHVGFSIQKPIESRGEVICPNDVINLLFITIMQWIKIILME